MTLPLTIRRFEENDLNEVWIIWHTELGNLSAEQVPSIAGYTGSDQDLLNIPDYYLKDGDGEFLVGVYQGKVVAITGLKKSAPTRGEIRHMSVDINHHRQGCGRLMMQAIEKRAIELGCSVLHLDTSIGQLPAQKLYLSCGFNELGRAIVGSGNWEIILYEKQISNRLTLE